ncbi:MAG: alanine racemase [Magnetococcales bacterium]|nr:alanine racemase [Magnetococcales bacterium]
MADNPQPRIQGRPTWLNIDLAAIVHNFHVAQKASGRQTVVYPVIKADGYGLGAIPIAKALAAAGAEGFCVALVEEAVALRKAGITQTLVVLSGFIPGLEQAIIDYHLQPVVFNLATAQQLSQCRREDQPAIPIHVKIDTGMGRVGFHPAKISTLLEEIDHLPGVRLVGILSHLACADELTGDSTSDQLAIFSNLINQIGQRDQSLRYSLANSAGLLGHPATRLDWTRPGILLYGASPFFPERTWQEEGLQPVVSWITHILAIREVPAGTPLGYGHDFVTQGASRIALLPVGYADGYSRQMQNRAQVLLCEQRAPVVGRISMDLTLVDVTAIPAATIGSRVTLLGKDGPEFIGIEEMASWMGTIPYETICRLSARVPRYYLPKASSTPPALD